MQSTGRLIHAGTDKKLVRRPIFFKPTAFASIKIPARLTSRGAAQP